MSFNKFMIRCGKYAFSMLTVLFMVTCSDDDPLEGNKYEDCKYLTNAESIGSVQSGLIRSTASIAGYPQFADYLDYSINVFKITYRTTFKGEQILASGIVSMPYGKNTPSDVAIIGSGLVLGDRDAPSSFRLPDNFTGFEFIGAVGYITIIADMIGFGVSKDLVYPVHNFEYSSSTMIDFIYACMEFFEVERIRLTGTNFMMGYSQGGYSVMSTLKKIEEDEINDIDIEAAAIGAGGDELVGLMRYALDRNTYPSPAHLAMLFTSYNEIYGWNRELTDFFKEPYAGRIPQLLNGSYDRQEADDELTTDFDNLFNAEFLEGLRDSTDTEVYSALVENSVYDWAPVVPLSIIHSVNDEKIPFADSQKAYDIMVENGSNSVTLVATETEGHINAALDFIQVVIDLFEAQ